MFLIEIIKTIILGIIEGVTEWLPISSTGHLILANELLKLDVSPQFMDMFNVVIQLGAIFAVILLYFNKLNPFSKNKTALQRSHTLQLWGKVIVGCIPAIICGFVLNDWMDTYFNKPLVVAVALIVYGIGFIVIERRNQHTAPSISSLENLDYKTAVQIGLFQCLALIPGTSRSGSTIIGGLLCGTSRFVAAEFSFFMGIPIMFGASGLKVLKFGFHFSMSELIILLVGCLVSFIVSVLVIKLLMNYIKQHDFQAFGWYRIILGGVILFTHLF